MPNEFALDVETLRRQAREHMEQGPVTPAYEGSTAQVVSVLNDVLATELVCWARYQQHAIVCAGINRAQVAQEFTEHAGEEMQHALWAAERVTQLGGQPDFTPNTLTARAHTEYKTFEDTDLVGMLKENLVAERIVIQSYQEVIRWLGDADPTTRRLLERILEQEEEHADDLNDLLGRV
jgi:bacterioferritin